VVRVVLAAVGLKGRGGGGCRGKRRKLAPDENGIENHEVNLLVRLCRNLQTRRYGYIRDKRPNSTLILKVLILYS
jgi:hypothetical protein